MKLFLPGGRTLPSQPSRSGFSIVELVIATVIILTLSALAVPRLQSARIAANEASAVAALRSIVTADYAYFTAYSAYAPQLSNLSENRTPCIPTPAAACIIDNVLANATPGHGTHSGYVFGVNAVSQGAGFVVAASPKDVGRTGNHDFCADNDGVLRSFPAQSGDQPVTTQSQCSTFAALGGAGPSQPGEGGNGGGGDGGGGGEGSGGDGH